MHILLAVLASSCLLLPSFALVGREHTTLYGNVNNQRCHSASTTSNNRRSASRINAFATPTRPTSLRRHRRSNGTNAWGKICYCGASIRRPILLSRSQERVTALSARKPRIDTDDDDYYPDRGRIDPPPARALRRPFTGEEDDRIPAQRSGGERGRGGGRGRGGAGRPGTMAGRGVESRTSWPAAASAEGTRIGIDQNDPLVKAWNSAKVLNPSRDEVPLVGGWKRGEGRDQGHGRQSTWEKKSFVRDTPEAISARQSWGGRRDTRGAQGRGRGRGGRGGRGRTLAPHVGMYKGDDSVPWYLKEVQDKGLDTEGKFTAWWRTNVDPDKVIAEIENLTVAQIKVQLKNMGLPVTGLKPELGERLAKALLRFSLSNDNFQHAEVVDTISQTKDLPDCFPQVYEKLSEQELEALWRESVRKDKAS